MCSINLSYLQLSPVLPVGGISLKFSKQTRGTLESEKQECCVNTTFGHKNMNMSSIIQKRNYYKGPPANFSVHSMQTGS